MCITPRWGVAFLLRMAQGAADCWSGTSGMTLLRLPNPGQCELSQMADAVSTASGGQPQGQHDFLLRWMEQVVVTNLLLEKCPFHSRHPTAANILQRCLPFPSFVSFFFLFFFTHFILCLQSPRPAPT